MNKKIIPWTLSNTELSVLDKELRARKPKLAAEAGSGSSTAVLSAHANQVVSLEHMSYFAAQTQQKIRGCDNVDLRCVPLVDVSTLGGVYKWYDTSLPNDIEFALIDGPPGSIGRQAAFFMFAEKMTEDGVIWVDDSERPHEKECFNIWSKYFSFSVRESDAPGFVCVEDIMRL